MRKISTKTKPNTVNKNVIFIINIIGFIGCIFTSIFVAFKASDSYSLMFFIPLIYGIVNFYPGQLLKYSSLSPGIIFFIIISFIRYYIAPLVTALSGSYTVTEGRYTSDQYFNEATILLVFEMIVVYSIAYMTLKKKNRSIIENENIVIKKSPTIILCFIMFAIVVGLLNPSILASYNFVFAGLNSHSNMDITNSGFFTVVVNSAKILIPLVFLYYGKVFYDQSPRFLYVVMALLPSIVVTMFAEGNRRGALLTPFILLLLLAMKIFPKYAKRIFILMGGSALSILIFMTIQKSIVSQSLELNVLSEQINWLAEYVDSYFAFIKHTAIAIETKVIYSSELGISTLLNDIFYPFLYLGGLLFDGVARSAVYFNYTFYDHTLITDRVIPTIGQGVIYLGYIFSPLFSALFLKLALEADIKYRSSTDLFGKYLWAYTAWTFAASINANINLLSKTLFQVIFPLFLIYLLYKLFIVKKRKKNNELSSIE